MIQEAESRLVLAVENAHVPECGRPPDLWHHAADDSYVGFFANKFGEQWVLVIDRPNKTGILRGGDIGWDEKIAIVKGHFEGDLILGAEERQWLDACWRAACGEPLAS